MNSKTHTLAIDAPKERVFEFLSNIANLPKWATLFCQELKPLGDGRHKIVTMAGEMFFRIESDAQTGVIDMFGGPTEDSMAHWPARVIEGPGPGSHVLFTSFQHRKKMTDENFAAQCDGLLREFPHILANTENR